jgi:polyhydroxyalkanoate synthase subunit PhaC
MTAPETAELAAPLDALLVDAAFGPLRRLMPDLSTARLAARLATQLATRPEPVLARLRDLVAELARVGAGSSDLAPAPKDRRFTDPAWTSSPVLRRIAQAYLAAGRTVDELIADAGLDWRDDQRVRFLAENLVEALAPSNVPLLNPASAKAAVDTGGLNFLRGGLNFLRDMASAPRVPRMVDSSAFTVGGNLATTPGAVVLRTELFELIQYGPQTPTVREVPLLLIPPTINKFYVLDLAPGRSWIEYLVRSGQQVFTLSWRNPDARHARHGLDSYVRAVLDALDAVLRICRTERAVLTGVCSGGVLASLAAARLAGAGTLDRLAGLGFAVTVLDHDRAGLPAALADRYLTGLATALSRRRGYLDGRVLAELFAWLRPGDLVWQYWVNNYLLGRQPPAFDVLYWNADTTRMPAALHADLIDLALHNRLAGGEGAGNGGGNGAGNGADGELAKVTVDGYVVAGVSDHITPWQNCYRTTGLLGGDTRFVLSTSGHIAAIVNPPGNPRASYRVNPQNPADPQEWLHGATTEPGSWWPDYVDWLRGRCGPERPAPGTLGGPGLAPLIEAPGTYVLDR